MNDDDMFPEIAMRRSLFVSGGPSHLNLILREVARMGGFYRGERKHVGRGRGAGVARVLGLVAPQAFQRTVRVAPRIMRVRGRVSAVQQHLRYLQREGVGRDTLRGTLYDGSKEHADGRSFLERSRTDPYQFRIVVAVEHGWEYPALRHLTRRLLKEMELDLGSELEWVAADHYNTGLPHTHVVLRGIDDHDQELRIARDYLREGMRLRAGKIVQLDLGPPDPADPRRLLFAEAEKRAPTPLEAQLETLADAHGRLVLAGKGFESFHHSLLAARLQTLKALGLAEELRGGRWQLHAHAPSTLEALATRAVRLGTLEGEITRHALVRCARQRAIFDPVSAGRGALIGCVLGQGRGNDGRNFLVVDGHDGRSYFVDLGFLAPLKAPAQAIVAITASARAPQRGDCVIAEVAKAHGWRYSLAYHRDHDPSLAPGEGERLLKRLAMLGAHLDLREIGPGLWQLEKDFLASITRFAKAQAQLYPVDVEVLAKTPLSQLVTMGALTWLDREPVRGLALSDFGFGRRLQDALSHRRQLHTAVDMPGPENAPIPGYGPQEAQPSRQGELAWTAHAGRQESLDRNRIDTNFCFVTQRERSPAIAR